MAKKAKTGARRSQNDLPQTVEERIAQWRRDRVGRVLNLSGLGLNAVPEGIRGLEGLVFLRLDGNKLTELAGWIGELGAIRVIQLDGNRLASLPDQIGSLRSLELLFLRGNDLESLPRSLIALPLELLDLRDNPRLGIP
jgi:Leucine-rich repeat (LRR) protein